MSAEWEQSKIEAALNQRSGMREERKIVLAAELETYGDWYTTCPKCHTHLTGTLKQMREHQCGTAA